MNQNRKIKKKLGAEGNVVSIILTDEQDIEIANLTKKSGENLDEVEIKQKYIEALADRIHLFSLDGELICRDLLDQPVYIEKLEHFIVALDGANFEYDFYQTIPASNFLNAVVSLTYRNKNFNPDDFVITPTSESIEFIKHHNIYLVGGVRPHNGIDFIGDKAELDNIDEDYLYFYQGFKKGLLHNGRVIIEPKFENILRTTIENIFWVKNKLSWHILDISDGFLIETDFDEIEEVGSLTYAVDRYYEGHEKGDLIELENLYRVKKGTKWGVSKINGDIILPPIYDELHFNRFARWRNGVCFDWIFGKKNELDYEFGNLLLNSNTGKFEVTGGDLKFCTEFSKNKIFGYITIDSNNEVTVYSLSPNNKLNSFSSICVVESYMKPNTGKINSISPKIKNEKVVFNDNLGKKTFNFWYMIKSIGLVYIDADYTIED